MEAILREFLGVVVVGKLTFKQKSGNVVGGWMGKVGTTPITPGQSVQFTVYPRWWGVYTVAWRTTWWSSDPVNAPVVLSDYWKGLTATVTIPVDARVGAMFQLTWKYANPNGVVMEIEQHCVIVEG